MGDTVDAQLQVQVYLNVTDQGGVVTYLIATAAAIGTFKATNKSSWLECNGYINPTKNWVYRFWLE